jgi:hypothetical protein
MTGSRIENGKLFFNEPLDIKNPPAMLHLR